VKYYLILISYIILIVTSFSWGIYVTEFKKFPYGEIKIVAIKVRNLISSNDDSEYRAEKPRLGYPHIRVVNQAERFADNVSIVVRSDETPIPDRFNFFDPLTGVYSFSLIKSDFNIEELPSEQCVLINGQPCKQYVKYTLKGSKKFKGTYIVTFADSINEKALEPTSDIFRFQQQYQCEVAVVYPDYTFLAYNTYGGHSLYSSPFPVAGEMSSSVVAYDRPMMSNNITKTYLPTHTIARSIAKMGLGCVSLETNSSLEIPEALNRYKLIVLAGHDEYWTGALEENLDNFVKAGNSLAVFSGNTNFRRLVVEGNSVRRDKHTSEFHPTENIIGLACRFGCLPVKDIKEIKGANSVNQNFSSNFHLRGMKVLDENHPIFMNTNLKKNDFFGSDNSLIWYEIDGAPLDPSTEEISYQIVPKVTPTYDGATLLNSPYEAKNVKPLASTYLRYFSSIETQYVASFIEYKNGDGIVLNGGSVGWYRVLEDDEVSKLIFQNSITYLLERNE
jgi:hypothetical protein